MKKIFAILAILFLVGCISEVEELKTPESTKVIEETTIEKITDIKETIEEPTETETIPEIEGTRLNIGESLTILGKTIKILDINVNGETRIDVDGVQRTLETTRSEEIVDNIKIYSTRTKFTPSEKYVVLIVEPFELNTNEHIIFVSVEDENKIETKGVTIVLNDLDVGDNSIFISTKSVGSKRIREGYSERLGDLRITNIKAFPNEVGHEKYALIKVEEI